VKAMNMNKISEFKLIILCSLLSILIFISDTFIQLGVAGGVLYICVILLSLWSKKKNTPVIFAVIGSILTIAGYFSSPIGGELWKVISNRMVAIFAIWVTALLGKQRIKLGTEKEKAVSDLKRLEGMLPICSCCKKVRDDDGSWDQLEVYIEQHSGASFTHGLCPDCGEKLYGSEKWHKITNSKNK
jgi:hypothetical protein